MAVEYEVLLSKLNLSINGRFGSVIWAQIWATLMCRDEEIANDLDGYNRSRNHIDDKDLMLRMARKYIENLIEYFSDANDDEECKKVANDAMAYIHFYTLMINRKIGDSYFLIKTEYSKNHITIKGVISELSKTLELIVEKFESHKKKTISLTTTRSNSINVDEKLKEWWEEEGKFLKYLPTQKSIADQIGVTAAAICKSKFFRNIILPQLGEKDADKTNTRYKKNNLTYNTSQLNENIVKYKNINDLKEDEIEFKEIIEENDKLKKELLCLIDKKIEFFNEQGKNKIVEDLKNFKDQGIDTSDNRNVRFFMGLWKNLNSQ
jgi:hypothetical protein